MKRSVILRGLLAGTVLLLFGIPEVARALDAGARFREANAKFASGQYVRAADEFRAILDSGQVSAALLFDLGNAESRAGRVGHAILSYRRALALAPRDPDILANLRQTRAAADLEAPQRSGWQQVAAIQTVDGWAWLATGAAWVACTLVIVATLRRSPLPGPSRWPPAAVLALAVAAITCGLLARTRLEQLDEAVVLDPPPSLRVAPFEAATASTRLIAGSTVAWEREHGGYVLVRTSDGQAGWLARTEVERVLEP